MESNSRFSKRLSHLEKSIQAAQPPATGSTSKWDHLSPEELKQKYMELVHAPIPDEVMERYMQMSPQELVQLYRSKLNENPRPNRKTSRWNRA